MKDKPLLEELVYLIKRFPNYYDLGEKLIELVNKIKNDNDKTKREPTY